MKRTNILYWVFTGLMSLFFLPGAVMNMLSTPESLEVFRHIGFPDYMSPFMGTLKLLGVIAILIPGYPRIKEWAYAGLAYDLVGAGFASIVVSDPFYKLIGFPIGLGIIFGSYWFHHKRLGA